MKDENENIDAKNEEFGDKIGAHYRRVSGEEKQIKMFIKDVRNVNTYKVLQRATLIEKIKTGLKIIAIIAIIFAFSYLFIFKQKPEAPQQQSAPVSKVEQSATNTTYKKVILVCLNKFSAEESKSISRLISDKFATNLDVYVNSATKYLNAEFKISQKILNDSLVIILTNSDKSDYDEAGRIIRNAFKYSGAGATILIIGEIPEKSATEMQKIKKAGFAANPITKKSDWQALADKKGIEVVWISPGKINELTKEMITGSVDYFSDKIKISTLMY